MTWAQKTPTSGITASLRDIQNQEAANTSISATSAGPQAMSGRHSMSHSVHDTPTPGEGNSLGRLSCCMSKQATRSPLHDCV